MKALPFKSSHLFLAIFLLLWVLSAAQRPVQDGAVMAGVATNIALEGRIDYGYRAPGYTVDGVDGRHYAKYPVAWSVALVPGQYLERMISVSGMDPTDKETFIRLARGLIPAITGSLAVTLLFSTLLLLGHSVTVALASGLSFSLATCALPYLRSFYSEVFLMAAVNLGLYCLARYRKMPDGVGAAVLGLAAGAVVLAKFTLAPVTFALVAAGTAVAFTSGKRVAKHAALGLIGISGPLFLLLAYNQVRFGSPFTWDYGYYPVRLALDHPVLHGLYGLLLSPGRGLLWFAPVSVLAVFGVARTRRENAWVTSAAAFSFLAVLFLHSAYTIWHGAEQWGPRFLVPVTGPLAVIAAPAIARLVTGGTVRRLTLALLVAAGLMVNVPGVLIHPSIFYEALPYRPYSEIRLDKDGMPTEPVEDDNLYRANFVPRFSPIVGHWWLLGHAVSGGDLADDCPWRGLVTSGPVIRTAGLDPSIDLWFLGEGKEGAGAKSLGLLGVMLLALAGAAWECTRRAVRREPDRS